MASASRCTKGPSRLASAQAESLARLAPSRFTRSQGFSAQRGEATRSKAGSPSQYTVSW